MPMFTLRGSAASELRRTADSEKLDERHRKLLGRAGDAAEEGADEFGLEVRVGRGRHLPPRAPPSAPTLFATPSPPVTPAITHQLATSCAGDGLTRAVLSSTRRSHRARSSALLGLQ